MSVEIEFPLEFLVAGTPVSLSAKRRESVDQWKARIVDASRSVLPEGHFATGNPIAATLFYFPAAEMAGDIDNIVKPVLDALGNRIYVDDRQVHRVLVQKFGPGNVFGFEAPSKSSLQIRAIPPHKRGVSRSSRTRGGVRWTRQRQARNVMQGGFSGIRERSNGGLTNDVAAYGEVVWF
jgi:crossover junction endodeoxyribonuclease RusA